MKSCESELATLQKIAKGETWAQFLFSGRRSSGERKRYLAGKMYAAQQKIQALEKQNVELKRILARQV